MGLDRVALVLEILGGVFLVVGAAVWSLALGAVVAGLVLILFGLALENGDR